MTMRSFIPLTLLAAATACGGNPKPAATSNGSGAPTDVATDSRTVLEKRRDTACDSLGPKITQCAVADAKAELATGKTTQKQFDQDTVPAVLSKNTEKFLEQCKVPMSSRQVRVLEICFKEEAECAPLLDCLTHLSDGAK